MMSLVQQRWRQAAAECALHIERLNHARRRSAAWFPLDPQRYARLGADDITVLDQLVYRFAKLQDSMGERLLPVTLALLGEEVARKPFMDVLNRLEQLNLVPSAQRWLTLREIRNGLAHEYPEHEDERIAALQLLPAAADELIAIHNQVVEFIRQRGDKDEG